MRLMKRVMALLCAVLLLGVGGAFAANAGSAQDPLLSKSYVLQWEQMLLEDRAARADAAAAPLFTDASRALEMQRVRCGRSGVRQALIPSGARIALSEGDTITLRSGSGSLQGGALIDLTAGEAFSGGTMPLRHRVLLSNGAQAVFTAAEESRVTLTGTAVLSRYADVSPAEWYGAAIDYADVRSLMNGTGSGAFSPSSTLTRAMFVTILGRMAGVQEGDFPGTSFSDVRPGTWYAPYVEWGAKNGIVNGMGEGIFAPDSPVTREQMAALITRYADAAGYDLPAGVSAVAAFRDAGSISGWAFESVERMRQTGLLSGDPQGNFNPLNGATRAEAATVFMRLDATLRIL